MALGDKPSSLPRWATAANRTLEPPENGATVHSKDAGWLAGKRPQPRYFNWWQNLVYQWAAYLDAFESKAHTWTLSNLFTAGVVVTREDGAGTAVTGTGNGSGAGVSGTGGTTGVGVEGTGGSGGGVGVAGLATGNAAGVTGSGGLGSGAGVSGTGGSGGSGGVGVSGTGGSGAAAGLYGQGASGGGSGVTGVGGSGGYGVQGQGGTNAPGGAFSGHGTGAGVVAQGGASGPAVNVGTGGQTFTGTAPTKSADPGRDNYQGPSNIIHARGVYRYTSGGTSDADRNLDGFSWSCSTSGGEVTVTFARAMASANYSLMVRMTHAPMSGGTTFKYLEALDADKTASGFVVRQIMTDFSGGGAALENWAAGQGFEFILSGRQ